MARRNRTQSSVFTDTGSLDVVVCEHARVSRDRRYDGLFFSGVRTTGVYCRPVCPVRAAKAQNVSFYPSAAAAEQEGFRPCLRCRPETAPFSPAWKGSQTTVERAVRLINEGVLDDAGVEVLAERLGIGSRHLSRLFTRHLRASPTRVARTARVQRAKRLLDETDLSNVGDCISVGLSQPAALQHGIRRGVPAATDNTPATTSAQLTRP
jgi:AraC family transcriptional regulator, regulatory protein of adaptative response / methylated-DNA-[protein]-cysteine methyltransferase